MILPGFLASVFMWRVLLLLFIFRFDFGHDDLSCKAIVLQCLLVQVLQRLLEAVHFYIYSFLMNEQERRCLAP